jgi:hypothetical protein
MADNIKATWKPVSMIFVPRTMLGINSLFSQIIHGYGPMCNFRCLDTVAKSSGLL